MMNENITQVCTICETRVEQNSINCGECGVEMEFIDKKIYATEDEKVILKEQFRVMYMAFNQKKIVFQNKINNTKDKRKKEWQKKMALKKSLLEVTTEIEKLKSDSIEFEKELENYKGEAEKNYVLLIGEKQNVTVAEQKIEALEKTIEKLKEVISSKELKLRMEKKFYELMEAKIESVIETNFSNETSIDPDLAKSLLPIELIKTRKRCLDDYGYFKRFIFRRTINFLEPMLNKIFQESELKEIEALQQERFDELKKSVKINLESTVKNIELACLEKVNKNFERIESQVHENPKWSSYQADKNMAKGIIIVGVVLIVASFLYYFRRKLPINGTDYINHLIHFIPAIFALLFINFGFRTMMRLSEKIEASREQNMKLLKAAYSGNENASQITIVREPESKRSDTDFLNIIAELYEKTISIFRKE